MPESPVERIFLDWSAPALPAAARRLAEAYAGEAELGMANVVLALPGSRAGRRLKELLLDESQARSLRLIPPRITTIGELPELLYEPPEPLADAVLARRLWARSLAALPPRRLATVFPDRPAPADLRRWDALAGDVDRVHHEVIGAGLRFGDVAERCGADPDLLYDDAERWAVLAEAQTGYEEELRRVGRMDPGLARLRALERGEVRCERELWIVGVAEMPALTRALLRSLGRPPDAGAPRRAAPGNFPAGPAGPPRPVRVLIHAPERLARGFDDVGCVRPEHWLEAEVPVRDAQLQVCDRPPDQAAAALHAVAELGGRYAPDQIAIAVPAADVVPYLEQRLGGAGLPVRFAAGVPVARSAPFRLLAALADYLDGRRFDAFAGLLRHPDLRRWLRRAAAAATAPAQLAEPDRALVAADRYFTRHLPARLGRPLAGEPGTRDRRLVAALRRVLDHEELLGGLAGQARLSEWAPRVLRRLVAVYGPEPLNRERPRERRLVEACTRIRDAAAACHRLPERADAVCDAATAIRLILAEAERGTIPPDPDRAAIELLGWLELHLDDAPVTIVTGFSEPFLPESMNADAFLPNRLRSALGLQDNARRYARDAYQLTAMLHSRDEVRLIGGRRDAAGDPVRPSRLMLAVRGATLAQRVRRFYGEAPIPAPTPAPGAGRLRPDNASGAADSPGPRAVDAASGTSVPPPLHPVDGASGTAPAPAPEAAGLRPENASGAADSPERETAPSFQLPPEPVIRAPEPLMSLRVTDFRTLIADPYLFALERVLGLEPLDDAARELDAMRFGSLVHRVLQAFGHTPEIHSSDYDAVRSRLDSLLEADSARNFGRAALPTVRLQVEQLRARLRPFARWHADWIAAGWRVVAVEGDRPGDPRPPGRAREDATIAFPTDDGTFTIRGRIDRVDHHAGTDRWAVFDYKTGDSSNDPERTHRAGRGAAREWRDLQLPLYRHLVLALEDAGGRPIVPPTAADRALLGYIRLPRTVEETGEAFAKWTREELETADEKAREVIGLVRENRFRFEPGVSGRSARGPLAALLGRGQLAASLADAASGAPGGDDAGEDA